MVGRPYWSGQLKISLVAFGIQLFPAASSYSGVTFHQIDRGSGQRIRHLNVIDEDKPIDNSDIVKGYEYSKGEYLILEPEEISKLRIETNKVIEISQFVDLDQLFPSLFEKPYFVVPQPKESPDAFAVMRKAMEQTHKAALGEIAFGGREHLIAIVVPPDKLSRGMMAYSLRYSEELRKPEEYFSEIPQPLIDKKQLAMASELIRAYSAPFHLDEFKDDYEAALRKLIEAKQKHLPLPLEEEKRQRPKVVSLMDALRRSVTEAKRPPARERRGTERASTKGPMLVKGSKRKHRAA
ncbi:MAG: Ku protein [Terracidiphilus sp.]